MIMDTLFALTKLGYLFAMWQILAISTNAIAQGHRTLPLASLSILIGLSHFTI